MLYDGFYTDKDGNRFYAKCVEDIPKDIMNKDDSEMPSDSESSEDEYEEMNELTDSFIPRDCKYLNRLDLIRYSGYTERLKTLNHFVRSFVPHYTETGKNLSETLFNESVPPNVKEAVARALISACNQISRIAEKDLEPISVEPPEDILPYAEDDSPIDDG